jgi:iron complex transport system substrate-binding protein
VLVASGYGVYSAYYASPSDSTPQEGTITVTDNAGNTMNITLPVTRIAALDQSVAEILCAMGAEDLIVARTDSCTMPPSLLDVTSYGENDYAPNVEGLIAADVDVIFASSMLPYNPTVYQQLIDAGIPIYIVDTTTPEPINPSEMTKDELYALPTQIDTTCSLMQNFTQIVGHQDKVDAYESWAQNYNQIVKDRIYTLDPDQRAKVFMEFYTYPFQTFVTASIYQSGGVNIAENQSIYSPTLNPEFVVEQNPDVIIEMISSPTNNIDDFVDAQNAIMARSTTQNTDAVKNGHVYVCDFATRNGARSVVGYLYFAKWIQPDLFTDIDPAAVNAELNQQFFGTDIDGTFAYP